MSSPTPPLKKLKSRKKTVRGRSLSPGTSSASKKSNSPKFSTFPKNTTISKNGGSKSPYASPSKNPLIEQLFKNEKNGTESHTPVNSLLDENDESSKSSNNVSSTTNGGGSFEEEKKKKFRKVLRHGTIWSNVRTKKAKKPSPKKGPITLIEAQKSLSLTSTIPPFPTSKISQKSKVIKKSPLFPLSAPNLRKPEVKGQGGKVPNAPDEKMKKDEILKKKKSILIQRGKSTPVTSEEVQSAEEEIKIIENLVEIGQKIKKIRFSDDMKSTS